MSRLQSIPRFFERHFILVAVILSGLSLWQPSLFIWIKPHIPLGLGVIMFGMGLTLDFDDFREIFRKWRLVGLGVVLQFTVMPLSAILLAHVFNLPVVFPLIDGLILRRVFRKRLEPVLHWFPSVSITVIALLVACIVGLNRAALLAFPALVFLAVALHNGLGLAVGYVSGRLLGQHESDCRTLAIEVGMQNSGLGVALAAQYFGAASALPGALFSLWHNISGVFLATFWRRTRGSL
ncbi:bile acid:sodium symporter family protein [Salidesulfovibrio onnuriiensis]|uniref:bile acid:sodium symporter family protein n=1 Tax=Salidesulfovibrio onnuriiensis TaxID=2583823 RepID=UPI0011C98685|nr:bile acid:sodium symporter family protein [Salidesulfovibrio onnuriiensis]